MSWVFGKYIANAHNNYYEAFLLYRCGYRLLDCSIEVDDTALFKFEALIIYNYDFIIVS